MSIIKGKNIHPLHQTQKVHITVADVDKKIVPLVKWLNSFKSITTLYCCQGSADQEAYIIFTCPDERTLLYLLGTLTFSGTRVEVSLYNGLKRYTIFIKQSWLESVIKKVPKTQVF